MDRRCTFKSYNYKTHRRKRENLHDLVFGIDFLKMTLKAVKDKRDPLDIFKMKTLCIKGHSQESEKTTHRMIEDIYYR